jgi:protein TonB
MTADGFLAQKPRHPLAMTAAIAINVAAVTALMLAKSGYVEIVPPGAIPLINIIDKPPPEPIKEIQDKPKARTNRPVFVPKPVETPTDTKRPDDGMIVDWVIKDDFKDPGPPLVIKRPDAPAPVTVGAVPDTRYAGDFQPPYPPQLLRTGVEGKAVIKVLIGTDGRVKQVAIVSADDPLFADASERQALRRWRFKPATRDGVPVETWKQMTVRFEIRA